MVPISSVKISRVPTYSGFCSLFQDFVYGSFTLFALPFQINSTIHSDTISQSLPRKRYVLGLGSSDFARHYFRNHYCFLFLRVLRCFSSPSSPPRTYFVRYGIARCYSYGVPSFGYLRVLGYLLLSATFRSLSRPSSAPCTKASSVSPL